MQRERLGVILLCVCLPAAGCKLLTPLVFVGGDTKKVLPEFDKLSGSRTAILVWTDQSTLFDYPFARFELAAYTADKLRSETEQRTLDVTVIDPREVDDYLQRNLDAGIDPQAVGRQFNADYIIYLEILDFQVRDADQPQFLQGRVRASVTVHDIRADPDLPRVYELTPVLCTYPEHGPVLLSATNSPQIREATYHKFSELVARKFYEHTIEF